MACGMLNPRYWPGLEKERPAETEEGAEDAVVVAEEASRSPPLGTAALTPLIALKDPAAKPATVLAVVVIALTIVIIVLPTSPRTIRLAMNGIKAIDSEKILAVRARSIIWLEPTKLFRTPFALRTAFMLERFTADMRTWRIA